MLGVLVFGLTAFCAGSESSPKQKDVERIYVDDIYEGAFLEERPVMSGDALVCANHFITTGLFLTPSLSIEMFYRE